MVSRIPPYSVRPAAAADVAVIARHRAAMFRDMGMLPSPDSASLEAASARYLARAVPAGDYRGWLAELDGAVVAGAGMVLHPLLPRPGHLDGGTEAEVLNVYTAPAHRRRGLARLLMERVLDWCRAESIARVTLHASVEGRPLYAALGFAATTQMAWDVSG